MPDYQSQSRNRDKFRRATVVSAPTPMVHLPWCKEVLKEDQEQLPQAKVDEDRCKTWAEATLDITVAEWANPTYLLIKLPENSNDNI